MFLLLDSGINGFPYPTPNVLQRIPTYLDIYNTQGREAALKAWVQDPLFAVSYQNPRVDFVVANVPLFASAHERFDVVSFDPRGVGRSRAVQLE